MKLKTKYILFIAIIHLTAVVLSFFVFQEYKLIFIASEILILLSLTFAYSIYKSMVQPIELINAGVEAIRDRDFNVKFQATNQAETNTLIEVYNKMIDQLRAERVLQAEQHYFLEKLIQTSPTGIIILDFDQRIASCNLKAVQFLEHPEQTLHKKKLEEIEHPLALALSKINNDETKTVEMDGIKTFKCHKTHFIDRGFPHHFLLVEELTAEKLKIEKQAFGKVIRMMAHEVNNSTGPINSILESFNFYHKYLPKEESNPYKNALKVAQERIQKLNLFMRNFADVVRLPKPHLVQGDLRPILEDIVTLMSYQTAEKDIKFDLQTSTKPVLIKMDSRQMEQMLINIVKNAIEAIEEKGTISLSLTEKPLRLQIKDTGIGIPRDKANFLFSPFFSTKPDGQGVGLTLSREILINHGFSFTLSQNKDRGMTFQIDF